MAIPILPLMAMGGLAAMTPLGRILNTPGALLRGALAGRLGDELSGAELMGEWFGPSDYIMPPAKTGRGDPGPFRGRPGTIPGDEPEQSLGVNEPGGFNVRRSARPNLPGVVGGTMGLPPEEGQLVPARQQYIDSPEAQIGGLLAELILDPLNLLGAGAGALAGSRVSSALGRAGQKALLAEQINSLGKIEDVANFGKTLTGTGDDIVPLAMRGMAEGPAYQAATAAHAMPYQPAILDELGGKMATYNRIDDAARDMMMRTGMGFPTGSGGMTTFLPTQARRPTYLAGRGGKMFLDDPAWAGLQPDDLLVGGGLYDKPADLAGLLPKEQLAELSQMAYRDPMGVPVDLLRAPMGEAADLATDMLSQRVRMSEQIPEPNAIIQAMYRMGFR